VILAMGDLSGIAKMIIGIGAGLVLLGGVMLLLSKTGLGKLPGDIFIRRGNFTFYFPVVSMLLLSLILTIIANVIFRR